MGTREQLSVDYARAWFVPRPASGMRAGTEQIVNLLAESLSLAISLPTMIVGFARHSRLGGQVLGLVPSVFLLPLLAAIVLASAVKI